MEWSKVFHCPEWKFFANGLVQTPDDKSERGKQVEYRVETASC